MSSFGLPQIAVPQGSGFAVASRILFLAVLIGLLLIPLEMIRGLVAERHGRSLQVEADVAQLWGEGQAIGGPVLTIPYLVRESVIRNGQREEQAHKELAYFLPETLGIDARLSSEIRYKSIYEVLVYLAEAKLEGRFAPPQFDSWGIAPGDILWNEATLALGITDMSGIRRMELQVNSRPVPVSPGMLTGQIFRSGAHARLATLTRDTGFAFSVDLALNGSQRLEFLPVGGDTTLQIAADWPHPNFIGAFLPVERKIDAQGFTARWTVSQLARNYPQAWRAADLSFDTVDDARIGLDLTLPGDTYQQTDRIAKYGVLIVGLTFSTIFLLGLLRSARAHFVQYLLVGGSICVFYLLLLSLSEHISFRLAYAIASAIDIAVIALYTARTIRPLLGAIMAALLAALHGFMYLLLQAEDYALLAGSIGLLACLIVVMIVTRNIDWFAIGEDSRRNSAAAPAG
jgi:inner membrane protein